MNFGLPTASTSQALNHEDKLRQITQYDFINANNCISLLSQIIRILSNMYCPIRSTGKYHWSFIMYTDAEFKMLPGIRDDSTNPPTPGAAVAIPTDPNVGTPSVNTFLQAHDHAQKLQTYMDYENTLKLASQMIQHAYPKGDYFLDKMDAYGVLHEHPRKLWDYLFKHYVTGQMKDKEIIASEKMIQSEYNPDESINTFFRKYQDGEFVLIKLGVSPGEARLIRNALHALSQHADLSRAVRKWRDEVEKNASANPVVRTTWDMFKTFFVKELNLLRNDPSTKAKLNMANLVREEIKTANENTEVTAKALLDLNKKVEELESKKNDSQTEMMQQLLATMKQCIQAPKTDDQSGGGRGRGRGRGQNKNKNWKPNDLPNGERTFRRYPDTNGYCWSCGFDVSPNHKCPVKKPGHKDEATVENRMEGSERNLHLYKK